MATTSRSRLVPVTAVATSLALALAASACSGSSNDGPTLQRVEGGTLPGPDGVTMPDGAPPHTINLEGGTTSTTEWTPTTTGPLPVVPTAAPTVCPGEPDQTQNSIQTTTTTYRANAGNAANAADSPVSATQQSQQALVAAIDDPRLQTSAVGLSIWVDGWGEIASRNPYRVYPIASNEKLFTAVGAYERLDTNEHVRTTVIATGPTVDGAIEGDVVLVGGGDPTVTRSGTRSLDALTTQLRSKGINRITGKVLVDESRYDTQRSVAGWPDGWQSTIGVLSALVVDGNKNVDPDDPALALGEAFKASMVAGGIAVGEVAHGTADQGVEIAALEGPTYGELITQMLQTSDNLVAELLVKEIGKRHTGNGTTADGLASIRDAVAVLCVPPGGAEVDGSGWHPSDVHSANQIRRLLQLVADRSWAPRFRGSLPVAGQVGTLAGRLIGPRTTGNVRAKTGSIAVSKVLSGYTTTAGGRPAYFSIIVNGNLTGGLEPVIDNIVAAIAALEG